MAGNRAGGLKAAVKNKANNPDFYKELGARGGSAPSDKPRGFAVMPHDRLVEASKKGGTRSSRRYGPEEREDKSKRMKRAWELLKQDERPTT